MNLQWVWWLLPAVILVAGLVASWWAGYTVYRHTNNGVGSVAGVTLVCGLVCTFVAAVAFVAGGLLWEALR